MHAPELMQKWGGGMFVVSLVALWGGRRSRRSIAEMLGTSWVVFFMIALAAGAALWIVGRMWEKRNLRERFSVYNAATGGWSGADIRTGRDVERDLIRLPGPPAPARIRYYHHDFPGGRRDYTEFTADLAWNGGALRISTPEWTAALHRYYGGHDLTIGDADFDRRFVVQGNPADFAHRFLDEATRETIRSFHRYGVGPFLLQVHPPICWCA